MLTTDRGDVVELLDRDGDAFAAYRYDEWGNPLGSGDHATGVWTQATTLIDATTAGLIADRQILRYAGYAYDAESGLYYCSARYYDPVTRQWTTKDEVKADGEESAYQYCGGVPVSQVDPSGFAAGNALADSESSWRKAIDRWREILEEDKKVTKEIKTFLNKKLPQVMRDWAPFYKILEDALVHGKAPSTSGICLEALAVLPWTKWAEPLLEAGAGKLVKGTFRYLWRQLRGSSRYTLRERLLDKVSNERLSGLIDQLYRPPAKVGDGSSMDYWRWEKTAKGMQPSESGHCRKCIMRRRELKKLLRSGALEGDGLRIAKSLLRNLNDAMGD